MGTKHAAKATNQFNLRSDTRTPPPEGEESLHAGDIQVVMDIIRRSACLHVEAVKNVATLEYDPKLPNKGRTHLSTDNGLRENQFRYLNWRAVAAIESTGLRWGKMRVAGRWVEPYRRKCQAEIRFPELKRVNELTSRIRVGILEALVFDSTVGSFESPEGYALASRLLKAIASWDYPTVAEIAEAYPLVREGLGQVLGISDHELAAMGCLDAEAWHALGEAEELFEAFYVKKLSA